MNFDGWKVEEEERKMVSLGGGQGRGWRVAEVILLIYDFLTLFF